jgi:hypothetical protein
MFLLIQVLPVSVNKLNACSQVKLKTNAKVENTARSGAVREKIHIVLSSFDYSSNSRL